ncbi:retrovirus-related Pol polyprotein from transposon 297 [Trichonephila inaurata madagascariensis]|uniref:RNA-directed DNA polymerase n=1 Tax=Trichonephila inaurata madagascariensis TaxID=2747483 RepID=A0A8X6Y8W6_9ARAC|nr:retrovirus-related Pol polyprotein from transposon 297 [Trichonephila inaurata madagascariensis]
MHIDLVLGRLKVAGLKVKPSKCRFAQEEVLFLGHTVGSGSRSPSDMKIKAIKDFPPPTTKTQVRSFLGIVGYYAHYIPNYSEIASPLTDALKGKIKRESITWDEGCEKAFAELKDLHSGHHKLHPDVFGALIENKICSCGTLKSAGPKDNCLRLMRNQAMTSVRSIETRRTQMAENVTKQNSGLQKTIVFSIVLGESTDVAHVDFLAIIA